MTNLWHSELSRRIPILMYHSISDKIERVHPYYQTCTSPEVFKRHLQYLKENDYHVLSIEQAAELLVSQQQMSKKVVITFDDGFRDFYTNAAPLLRAYGFTADIFLPTHYITNHNSDFKGTACLNWKEVKELSQDGFHIGSHTVNHPILSAMGQFDIENEMILSKKIIEDQIGRVVNIFSYPYAFPDNNKGFSQYISNTLMKNGYIAGVTTRIGRSNKSDMPYLLKRIPANSQDDLKFFEAKLKGAYDWLYYIQRSYKKIKMIGKKESWKAG